MSDNEKRAHDFETMRNGKNPKQKREVLAASVLDEYNFFYDAFIESIK